MNIDYPNLERDVLSGAFRQTLQEELIVGFRMIAQEGERLPIASHYASQMAEIVSRGASAPFSPEIAFEIYQEILEACMHARDVVLADPSR